MSGVGMIWVLLLAQATAQTPLSLTCLGLVTKNGPPVVLHSIRVTGKPERVEVRLFAGKDWIWLPKSTLPIIHGGSRGWFRLKNVVADSHLIRAKVWLGLSGKADVVIDRETGAIFVDLAGYQGQCRAIEEKPVPPR